MPGRLKRLLEREHEHERRQLDDEYRTMTPEEREEVEAVWWRGAEGEREFRVERAAERDEDVQQGRPPGLWRFVSGNGWFEDRRRRNGRREQRPQRR